MRDGASDPHKELNAIWFLYGFAIVAGVLNAVQSGAYASLNKALQQPFAAALTIVAVSFTTLLARRLLSGQLAWPGSEKIAGVPWWAWFGGVFGATYVMSQLLVAERVGAGRLHRPDGHGRRHRLRRLRPFRLARVQGAPGHLLAIHGRRPDDRRRRPDRGLLMHSMADVTGFTGREPATRPAGVVRHSFAFRAGSRRMRLRP